MQAQENSNDQKTSDALNELGELFEKVNLYEKTTVSNNGSTENEDGNMKESSDEKLEIGSSRWKISQFNEELYKKIALLQEKIEEIAGIIDVGSPTTYISPSITGTSEVESLSKEAKQGIDRISDLLTSKGSNLYFNRAIEEFLSFTNSEYNSIESLDLDELGDSLYSFISRLESVSLDGNQSTREHHLPDDNLFLRTILLNQMVLIVF